MTFIQYLPSPRLLLTIFAAVTLCLPPPVASAEAPAAVEKLKESGAKVRGDAEKGYQVSISGDEENPATAEQMKLIVALNNVSKIDLDEIANPDLAILEPIAPGVERFAINSNLLNDEGVGHVAMFKNVEVLGMRTDQKNPGPAITPEGMRQLQGFSNVTKLGIGGHDFPADALALLPELFPTATEVDFNHTFNVDAAVFEAFQQFPNLEILNLGGCVKTDEAGMRALGGLKNLKTLSIFHAGRYQWAALEALKGHPNLQSFRIGDGRPKWRPEQRVITDEDLEMLLTIPTLESFGTGGDANGGLTDAAGKVLAKHPNLKRLTVNRPEFTGQLLRNLQAAPALEEIVIDFDQHTPESLALLTDYPALKKIRLGGYRQGTPIDDARLAALHGIPDLQELDIWMTADSNPSEEAIEQLQAAYPDFEVRVRYGLDHKK